MIFVKLVYVQINFFDIKASIFTDEVEEQAHIWVIPPIEKT